MTYKEYEKAVYDFLIERRKRKPEFNFSVRQKAAKGAETDYFIGTEKSGYFGFTFWDIPVSYPGSSSDLMNFIFWRVGADYIFKFQFVTSKAASGSQNETDLEYGRLLYDKLKEEGINVNGRPEKHKMLYYDIFPPKGYITIDELLKSFEELYDKLNTIIDNCISEIKSENPDWIAGRLTNERFDAMQRKMEERIAKYSAGGIGEEDDESLIPDDARPKTPEHEHYLNTILFGPPGTGKTYHTIDKAVCIINPKFAGRSRVEILEEYNNLVEKGQIVFTTFHQSLSYEDFIEGIKPMVVNNNITYDIVDGIFKTLCDVASKALKGTDATKQEKLYDSFINTLSEKIELERVVTLESRTKTKVIIHAVSPEGNLYASPYVEDGKEYKNYFVDRTKLLQLDASFDKIEEITNVVDDIRYVIGGVAHTYYWAALKAFKEYKIEKKQSTNKNTVDKYVLIVDEINRGNIAEIFGELITLIEPDKRKYNSEMIEVKLPYSKLPFSVPSNLYIIGTMNTADRSVEALDTALRRRFVFEETQPKPELLSPQNMLWRFWWEEEEFEWEEEEYVEREEKLHELLGIPKRYNGIELKKSIWEPMHKEGMKETQIEVFNDWEFNGVNLEKMLETINHRLSLLLDKDRSIGHAWFMSVRSIQDLYSVFKNSIIPLLQEFFYNDYGKIGLVIGESFFEEIPEKQNPNEVFAKFSKVDFDTKKDLSSKNIFNLKMPELDDLTDAVKNIYSSNVPKNINENN